MNKRLIIFAIGGLVILLALGGGLYFALQKQKQNQQPVAVVPQIKQVLDEAVNSPVPSLNNTAIWYFNSQGRLFRFNIDGKNLSEFSLPSLGGNLLRALWPKSGSDFIVISDSGGQIQKSFYNSTSGIYQNLANNIQYLDWLPDGSRIVYIWKSGDGKSQLTISDSDGSGFRSIVPVFWADLVVKAGSDGNTVLMYRANPQTDVNKIYAANLETGEISTIVSSGKSTGAKWLDSGNRFLFAQSSILVNPRIYLYDMTNRQAVDLSLVTTLDKIAVDKPGKFLYSAVPKQDNSGDTFVKIDLETYKSETYFEPSSPVFVKNMMLVGNSVYFVSNTDGKLYTISN